jgi:glutamate-1-semialdehyde 2,1-aminomutase
MDIRYQKSVELFRRATRVIPSGIYGFKNPLGSLPGVGPYYTARAEGSRFWDVDGNEYIDFLCGYGPVVLGHCDPTVEAAVRDAAAAGVCWNQPGESMVELAEKFVELIALAEWAVFGKNGVDMTTWALRVAREHTLRSKVIIAAGAYHGALPWCTAYRAGVTPQDRANTLEMQWNDVDSLERLVADHTGEIAAVMLTPYHHRFAGLQEMPEDGFWAQVRHICDREGIVLILDDVRAGFRLGLHGSHEIFGIEPDLVCYSKAIGNGYPIAAAVGTEALRSAAEAVFTTGTYWYSAVPMAASLAVFEVLEETDALDRLSRLGTRWAEGLERLGTESGFRVSVTGPPGLSYLTFDDDPNLYLMQVLAAEMITHGVFLPPYHHTFLTAAHTDDDIDRALEVAADAFKVTEQAIDQLPIQLESTRT